MLQTQQMFMHYHIEDWYSSSSIANIYKAFDTQQSRSVLVKESLDNKTQKYFKREFQIFASIDHENLINAYDFLCNKYIILELVQGISLKQLLQKNNNLTLVDKVAIAHRISTTISIFHKAGLFHFNVKPHDIFLIKGYGLKFTGLGTGKAFEMLASNISVANSVVDEIAYTSPEQLTENMSIKSSIFSLGVLLYQLFSGTKESPFYAPNLHNCYHKIKEYSPPPLLSIVKTQDQSQKAALRLISEIIEKAIYKDPIQRWQNVEDITEQFLSIYQLILPSFRKSNFSPAESIDNNVQKKLAEIDSSFKLEEPSQENSPHSKSPKKNTQIVTPQKRISRLENIKQQQKEKKKGKWRRFFFFITISLLSSYSLNSNFKTNSVLYKKKQSLQYHNSRQTTKIPQEFYYGQR